MVIIFKILLLLVVSELIIFFLIKILKKDFQWIITNDDETPIFKEDVLVNYYNGSYDSELGWLRPPNSSGFLKMRENSKINYNIDEKGYRTLGDQYTTTKIITFGDSYVFCATDDKNTWQSYLGKKLKTNILNYGVNNYGIDQALLRYKRIKKNINCELVILGFVPETICRIHSYWKHYLEFGNILAFKPMFEIKNNKLFLNENILFKNDKPKEILNKIGIIKNKDYFYKKKFLKYKLKFPFTFFFALNIKRNFYIFGLNIIRLLLNFFNIQNNINYKLRAKIMEENINFSHKLYHDKSKTDLLFSILNDFSEVNKDKSQKTLFVVMPQYFDLVKKDKTSSSYQAYFKNLSKKFEILELTNDLLKFNLNKIFIDDKFGGHYSEYGNKVVSEILYKKIKEMI